MSNLVNMYRQLLGLPLSVLVKNNPIPANPIEELALNIHQPIVYVLPYTSQTDFVIFRRNCLHLGLPDPAEKNEINGLQLPRYVYLDEGRRIFKSKGAKDETTKIFNKYLELHRTSDELDVQLIPVSVLWGRSPGHEDKSGLPNLRLLNGIQKIFAAIWFGRDTVRTKKLRKNSHAWRKCTSRNNAFPRPALVCRIVRRCSINCCNRR